MFGILDVVHGTYTQMTDLVVVGGGIVGVSSCYYAKQLGASCTLIERDGIAAHATGFSFGGLHPRVVATTESEMPQFASESFKEHQTLHELLESERTGLSTWGLRSSVSIAWNEFDASVFKEQAAVSSSAFWIDVNELHELESRISHDALGGLVIPGSAEVDSAALADALFRVAAPAFYLDEVVDVDRQSNRITGVRTRSGKTVRGEAFVFAMGPWSTRTLNWFGVDCAIKPLKGQILRLRIEGPAFQHSFSTNGNYMSTKTDGLLWIGTTEEEAGFDESPTPGGRQEIMKILRRILTDSRNAEIIKHTACLRPMTPNGELVLGGIPGVSNAYIGTGGGRKGILYGPLMGKYLTNLALANEHQNQWSSLSPDRYSGTS